MAEATSIMDCEIVSTRMFHMPREAIFAAFRDPVQLKEWWGPNGFKNTIETFDFQKDGIWKFTMHGPDGTDYHNVSTFAEIAEPVRIIFDHDKPIHRFRMTMTFDEQDGSTKVRWAMLFENIEECEKVKAFVPNANEQNFDRLEAVLAAQPAT